MLSTLLFIVLLSIASGQVIDLESGEEVENFIENGFITLSATQTVTVTTSNKFNEPVIILGAVFLANEYSDNIPLEARVVDYDNANQGGNKVVTFSITLVWPSNQTCVSDWYAGTAPEGDYTIGWYVGEAGAYDVSGVQMEFMTIDVNAYEWTTATWPSTFGSDCNYPTQDGDDDYAPGAMFTLQSNNNAGQYLTVRSSSWFKSSRTKCNYAWAAGDLRMYPHDYNSDDGLIDVNSIQAETVGMVVFDTRHPHTLDCFGGSFIEIGQINDMSSTPRQFPMYEALDTSSTNLGVFGSVLSLNGGEAMVVKTYATSSSPTDVFGFMQEDQCVDEEVFHYPEVYSYFLSSPTTTANCEYPVLGEHSFSPSMTPTISPTSPTQSPTEADSGGSGGSGSSSTKGSDVLLAIFLPICIIVVVAVVGIVTKRMFLNPSTPLDSSEHSGQNLV